MNISSLLQQALARVISDLGVGSIESAQIHLEHPNDASHGDYASNIALQLFSSLDSDIKQGYQSPRALAQTLAEKLEQRSEIQDTCASVTVAGPGFINFTLKATEHWQQLKESIENGIPQNLTGKAVVEYSSPNIAKPFTIGHLRSTIIGDAVANLLEVQGIKVHRDNHLGDWGTQFGKQIYAIKTWGNEAEIEQAERPVKKLVELYVKFHQEAEKDPSLDDAGRAWFKKLEDGDEEARRLWQKCIDWSWKEFNAIYEKLNISFTENGGRGYGESYFEDKMDVVVEELKTKGLLIESKGAQLVFFPDDMYPPAMIIKKDGATLYATRDLATDKWRLQTYGPETLIINEVGGEQELYFKQLFEIERMLGWVGEEQRVHVKHGLYRFKEGKMSTRRGNVIWLEDVLQEAFDRVKKIAGERIDDESIWKIATGALKWNDLRRKSELNVLFDWDEIIRLDGNAGPYLQYSYVRCMSILEKAAQEKISVIDDFSFDEQLLETEVAAIELVRFLNRYAEVVTLAASEYAPHHLTVYLFELAQRFSRFYDKHSVLQEADQTKQQLYLSLVTYTARTLKQGLALLGIEVVEKM